MHAAPPPPPLHPRLPVQGQSAKLRLVRQGRVMLRDLFELDPRPPLAGKLAAIAGGGGGGGLARASATSASTGTASESVSGIGAAYPQVRDKEGCCRLPPAACVQLLSALSFRDAHIPCRRRCHPSLPRRRRCAWRPASARWRASRA